MQATYPHPAAPFPARLEGHLEQPSRWLWLVKWLLVIPHFFVLAFLWLAFVLLSLVAFVALLFGGRYPRGIFDFNLGVLRWTWRVGFYAFAANGTDRYPPFTLADVPDYPARLEVDYPERQRHGLPLIGWWLLGIPQYCVAGIFAGGAGGIGWHATHHWSAAPGSGGLIDLLVFVAVLALLFRGDYPRSIFDLVAWPEPLGAARRRLRGADDARVPALPPRQRRERTRRRHDRRRPRLQPPSRTRLLARTHELGRGPRHRGRRGSLAVLAVWPRSPAARPRSSFDQTQRDASGYLMTGSTAYSTDTYALVSDSYRTGTAGDVLVARDMLGTVRIRTQSAQPVFVGVGPAAPSTPTSQVSAARSRHGSTLSRAISACTKAVHPRCRRPRRRSGRRRPWVPGHRQSPGRRRTATGGSLS